MRYNDFKHDPLARCPGVPGYCAGYSIACRDDLNDPNGTYPRPGLGLRDHAATDAKITSMEVSFILLLLVVAFEERSKQSDYFWSSL